MLQTNWDHNVLSFEKIYNNAKNNLSIYKGNIYVLFALQK